MLTRAHISLLFLPSRLVLTLPRLLLVFVHSTSPLALAGPVTFGLLKYLPYFLSQSVLISLCSTQGVGTYFNSYTGVLPDAWWAIPTICNQAIAKVEAMGYKHY